MIRLLKRSIRIGWAAYFRLRRRNANHGEVRVPFRRPSGTRGWGSRGCQGGALAHFCGRKRGVDRPTSCRNGECFPTSLPSYRTHRNEPGVAKRIGASPWQPVSCMEASACGQTSTNRKAPFIRPAGDTWRGTQRGKWRGRRSTTRIGGILRLARLFETAFQTSPFSSLEPHHHSMMTSQSVQGRDRANIIRCGFLYFLPHDGHGEFQPHQTCEGVSTSRGLGQCVRESFGTERHVPQSPGHPDLPGRSRFQNDSHLQPRRTSDRGTADSAGLGVCAGRRSQPAEQSEQRLTRSQMPDCPDSPAMARHTSPVECDGVIVTRRCPVVDTIPFEVQARFASDTSCLLNCSQASTLDWLSRLRTRMPHRAGFRRRKRRRVDLFPHFSMFNDCCRCNGNLFPNLTPRAPSADERCELVEVLREEIGNPRMLWLADAMSQNCFIAVFDDFDRIQHPHGLMVAIFAEEPESPRVYTWIEGRLTAI